MIAFDDPFVPGIRRRPPISDEKAGEPGAWRMNAEIRQQSWPPPDLGQQIEEELGAVHSQIDQPGCYRMRGPRILLGVRVAKEEPYQAEQVSEGLKRVIDAGL